MKQIILTALLIAGTTVWGQKQQITILDKADNGPIPYANVCWEEIQGQKKKGHSVTNHEGKAEFSTSQTVKLAISCVGYKTYTDTLRLSDEHTLFLAEDIFSLDQVVVTGEVKPMPVDSSIYKVKLITADKIQKTGSVNLGELLIAEPNIRMSTDLVLGSQIEMLGMSGQNVKIMIDGVPVIGRLDGNVDLSQINLANISQVEVIEGPMSVVYGNNALAGTINLITKENKHYKTSIQANAYAENIGRYAGNAYASQKTGRHYFNIDGGYEHFSGVDFDDNTRSMDWKPKRVYRINGGYGFNNKGWKLNANVGYYSDRLHVKSEPQNYKVYDTYYFTERFNASANLNKSWGMNHMNVVASYNFYDRLNQAFTKDLTKLESEYQDKESSQEATQKMLRATYSRQMGSLNLQMGVDLNVESMGGLRITDKGQDLGDYAGFICLKYKPFDMFEIQPGIRYAYNTKYKAPLVYSLNTKWNVFDNLTWRASVAKGFRAPDIKELYYQFVDSNHEIYGNPDLEAESSYNYNTSLEFALQQPVHKWIFKASAYYNDVTDMVALIQRDTTTGYHYDNIGSFESTGINLDVNYGYKSLFTLRLGYGFTGRYNIYTKENGSDRFNLTHDVFAGLKFTEPHTGIILAADYKYNGKLPYFYTDENDRVKEGFRQAYHTLNTSLTYDFWERRMQVVAGVKNLFDVTAINSVSGSGGGHSGGGGIPISYGRSYFINLIYKFNKY